MAWRGGKYRVTGPGIDVEVDAAGVAAYVVDDGYSRDPKPGLKVEVIEEPEWVPGPPLPPTRYYHVTGRHSVTGRPVDVVVDEKRARGILGGEYPNLKVELIPEDHVVSPVGGNIFYDVTEWERDHEARIAASTKRFDEARIRDLLADSPPPPKKGGRR